VRSGRIGKVHTVNVGVGGASGPCYLPAEPVPEGLDWDMWLGPAPVRPFHKQLHPFRWRAYFDYSGGGFTDIGAHHFDIAQWGLGTQYTGPVEVHPPDGKRYRSITFKYASGVTLYHGGANGIKFTGTDGIIEVNRGLFRSEPPYLIKEPLGPGDVQLYRSPNHHADWEDCIRTRRRPVADVEIGCRTITICHLGNIAHWLRRSLKWDPNREEILGDEEASRWLDRPRRAPWHI
jgi:predicted dehydrogenase